METSEEYAKNATEMWEELIADAKEAANNAKNDLEWASAIINLGYFQNQLASIPLKG